MMRMSRKSSTFAPMGKEAAAAAAAGEEWEVRPCGMLVQKRNPESESASAPAPTIRVRVKHGSASHEIYISSQATFGELKRVLSGPTGMHPLDQKIVYKDRERDSAAYLDTAGVKDRSKMAVFEDPKAQAKRCLEMRRAAKSEQAAKSISRISLDVDKLASKVSVLEGLVSKGKRVAEGDVLALIELLMNELLKLDAVTADGDVKLQRRTQVRRVQKYVEALDMIKIKNSAAAPAAAPKWETFEPVPTARRPSGAAPATSSGNQTARLDWELF